MLTGRVTRVAEFGAFVELAPGVEGLAHASTFPPTGKAGGWRDGVSVGMTGTFEVLSIDPEKRRIGVALVDRASTEEAAALRDYQERQTSSTEPASGTLADKLSGALESPRRKR
jgi:small subunit ribosomal protein S1